jgi:hypothetical protein
MRVLQPIFVMVIWLMIPSAARAQGNWLQKGVSGVGAEVTVSHQDGGNSLELRGAYSHKGFLDFSLALGSQDANMSGLPDLSVYYLGSEVDYHPLKQTKEIPISLKVGIAYTQFFYSSDTLSQNDSSISQWSVGLGGGAYRFFPLAERIGVTPEIDLVWVHSSVAETIFGDTQTLTDDRFGIGLTAAFAYLDSANHIWGVAPSLTFGPGNTPTTFGLSVAFITTLQGPR